MNMSRRLLLILFLAFFGVYAQLADGREVILIKGHEYNLENICGILSSYCMLKCANIQVELGALFEDAQITEEGMSVEDIINLLEKHGYPAACFQAKGVDSVEGYAGQCILWIRNDEKALIENHFVFLTAAGHESVHILDGQTLRELSFNDLNRLWSGVAIVKETKGYATLGTFVYFAAAVFVMLTIIALAWFLTRRSAPRSASSTHDPRLSGPA